MPNDLEKFSKTDHSHEQNDNFDSAKEFNVLRYSHELKNLEDINKVAEWFKKEEANILQHSYLTEKEIFSEGEEKKTALDEKSKYKKVSDRVALLASFLAKKQGKDARSIAEQFLEYSNEHDEDQDEMDDAYRKEYEEEDDFSWTRGDLQWMNEHILDYRINFGYGGSEPRKEAIHANEEIAQWYDDNLREAIRKWMEFLKTV